MKAQEHTVDYNQKTSVMVELASRMNEVVMEDGQTLLDHS